MALGRRSGRGSSRLPPPHQQVREAAAGKRSCTVPAPQVILLPVEYMNVITLLFPQNFCMQAMDLHVDQMLPIKRLAGDCRYLPGQAHLTTNAKPLNKPVLTAGRAGSLWGVLSEWPRGPPGVKASHPYLKAQEPRAMVFKSPYGLLPCFVFSYRGRCQKLSPVDGNRSSGQEQRTSDSSCHGWLASAALHIQRGPFPSARVRFLSREATISNAREIRMAKATWSVPEAGVWLW